MHQLDLRFPLFMNPMASKRVDKFGRIEATPEDQPGDRSPFGARSAGWGQAPGSPTSAGGDMGSQSGQFFGSAPWPRSGIEDAPYSPGRQTSQQRLSYGSTSGWQSTSALYESLPAVYSPPASGFSRQDPAAAMRQAQLGTSPSLGSPTGSFSEFASADAAGFGRGKSPAEVRTSFLRKPSNRDEFDGPHQLLEKPAETGPEISESDLPDLPTNLYAPEQEQILQSVHDRLSQCAFTFIARYQFPIPLEQNKRPVQGPQDRDWSEWVYLLKRLATKRRIPARVLYNQQIRQFISILDSSLDVRPPPKQQQPTPLKDDRNILQLISAALQVAKLLKDPAAMEFLDRIYVTTERILLERRQRAYRQTPGSI